MPSTNILAAIGNLSPAWFAALLGLATFVVLVGWTWLWTRLVDPIFERHDQEFIDYQQRRRERKRVLADRDDFHRWQYEAVEQSPFLKVQR